MGDSLLQGVPRENFYFHSSREHIHPIANKSFMEALIVSYQSQYFRQQVKWMWIIIILNLDIIILIRYNNDNIDVVVEDVLKKMSIILLLVDLSLSNIGNTFGAAMKSKQPSFSSNFTTSWDIIILHITVLSMEWEQILTYWLSFLPLMIEVLRRRKYET